MLEQKNECSYSRIYNPAEKGCVGDTEQICQLLWKEKLSMSESSSCRK